MRILAKKVSSVMLWPKKLEILNFKNNCENCKRAGKRPPECHAIEAKDTSKKW
jgi:hypothetical protein